MRSAAPELDIRRLPPPQRHPEIFRVFDALEPHGAFVLVNDHDPKPLLYQFQRERRGRFDWSVLEAGPQRFRVEIRRRGASPRGVAEYLAGDHRRLDAILEEVARLARTAAFSEAGTRFAEFACGLRRHIQIEEQVLFPAFEKPAAGGPTVVMRGEHVGILHLLERIAAGHEAQRAGDANGALEELTALLSLHNMKEERMLYPGFDRMTGDERAREDVVDQLQAF